MKEPTKEEKQKIYEESWGALSLKDLTIHDLASLFVLAGLYSSPEMLEGEDATSAVKLARQVAWEFIHQRETDVDFASEVDEEVKKEAEKSNQLGNK